MLTSKIRRKEPVPDYPNEWIEFRALGGRKQEEAEEVQQKKALEVGRLAGQELIQSISNSKRAEIETQAAEELKADPLQKYDIDTVLRCGIVAWSLPDRLTPANIDELPRHVRRWAALQIIELTEESEEGRKSTS